MAEKDTGFRGISKEDHDVLTKAADMYTKLTGETVAAVGKIPVIAPEETDPTIIQKLAEEQLTLQAEVTAKREAAQQAERQLAAGIKGQQEVEPILAPIAAQQAAGSAAAQAAFADKVPSPKGAAKREPMNVKTTG
jgi:hypothetical protein